MRMSVGALDQKLTVTFLLFVQTNVREPRYTSEPKNKESRR